MNLSNNAVKKFESLIDFTFEFDTHCNNEILIYTLFIT